MAFNNLLCSDLLVCCSKREMFLFLLLPDLLILVLLNEVTYGYCNVKEKNDSRRCFWVGGGGTDSIR